MTKMGEAAVASPVRVYLILFSMGICWEVVPLDDADYVNKRRKRKERPQN